MNTIYTARTVDVRETWDGMYTQLDDMNPRGFILQCIMNFYIFFFSESEKSC